MKYLFISLLATLFFLGSCQNWESSNSNSKNKHQNQSAKDQVTQSEVREYYPSFPFDSLKYLWENCDYIDVLYYDLPASMSIADTNSIRQMLSIIAAAPAPRTQACKPIGRLFFQVDGENRAAADLYFSDNCTFFVFMEDEKPRWGNLITDRGIAYFQNNIGQIMDLSKGVKPTQMQKAPSNE